MKAAVGMMQAITIDTTTLNSVANVRAMRPQETEVR